LFIHYQAPETIRQAVAMLDLMILDQQPGLGVVLRRPDLIQCLGVYFFKAHVVHNSLIILLKFNTLAAQGNR
jgi:hypothetical protein